jgi:hypothetical protein
MGQIWNDPWIAVATERGVGTGPWATTLPPPLPPPLPASVAFRCVPWPALTSEEQLTWLALVGTRWRPAVAAQRLVDAWLPMIVDSSGAIATCVLRPRGGPERLWLLETLRSKRGYGSTLMRQLMTWIWQRDGPFVLGFTWELTPFQLAGAWWSGWLAAAAAIEFGWIWRLPSACTFCPGAPVVVAPARFELPTLLRFGDAWAIVNDSGLCDGVGCVLDWRGDVPWATVAEAGGWSALWMRSAVSAGPKWLRTGEIVVVGLLNSAVPRCDRWITPEI